MLSRPLHSQHRLKNTPQIMQRSLRQIPQSRVETVPVYRSELIGHRLTVCTLKPARCTKRVRISARLERRNRESAKVLIQLVWGHHDTRARFPDFGSSQGIQSNMEDIASCDLLFSHHDHASSSSRVALITDMLTWQPRWRPPHILLLWLTLSMHRRRCMLSVLRLLH